MVWCYSNRWAKQRSQKSYIGIRYEIWRPVINWQATDDNGDRSWSCIWIFQRSNNLIHQLHWHHYGTTSASAKWAMTWLKSSSIRERTLDLQVESAWWIRWGWTSKKEPTEGGEPRDHYEYGIVEEAVVHQKHWFMSWDNSWTKKWHYSEKGFTAREVCWGILQEDMLANQWTVIGKGVTLWTNPKLY